MAISKKAPEGVGNVAKRRQVEVRTGQGVPRLVAIRQIAGMGMDQLKELKRLKKDNERLRELQCQVPRRVPE